MFICLQIKNSCNSWAWNIVWKYENCTKFNVWLRISWAFVNVKQPVFTPLLTWMAVFGTWKYVASRFLNVGDICAGTWRLRIIDKNVAACHHCASNFRYNNWAIKPFCRGLPAWIIAVPPMCRFNCKNERDTQKYSTNWTMNMSRV